ncbi:MAG TPA: helix-turn-helix domain-containing protein [archaeon]|nr:helix-turn-helix domain-containing protein [archaeon]
MVATMEVLDALKSIGLNLYERKIFVALLAKGVATAAEVSEIASVPRSRSYDVLESLVEKGFVVFQPSKPIKYMALAPKDALDRMQENTKKKQEETIERIEKLKSSPMIKEMEKVYKEGLNMVEPADMTGTLKGTSIIDRQLQSIFKTAKKTINIVTTEQGFSSLYSRHYRILKKIGKSGVKLKIAAPFVPGSEAAKSFADIAEIRNIKSASGRLVTVDDEHVLMALTDDKKVHETQDTVFWANSPHVVSSMAQPLFRQIWDSGSVAKKAN